MRQYLNRDYESQSDLEGQSVTHTTSPVIRIFPAIIILLDIKSTSSVPGPTVHVSNWRWRWYKIEVLTLRRYCVEGLQSHEIERGVDRTTIYCMSSKKGFYDVTTMRIRHSKEMGSPSSSAESSPKGSPTSLRKGSIWPAVSSCTGAK